MIYTPTLANIMKVIKHQFKNQPFYMPKWELKHLFIGTFNPSGGQKVDYYYGRERNRTWELLSEIFKESLNPTDNEFFEKLKKHGIACMDLIETLKAENKIVDQILGQGYKDSQIINGSVIRQYNIDNILDRINANRKVQVYSTWGKGQNLSEWKKEVEKNT